MLFERLRAPVISAGHIHDAENVGTMLQSGGDEARPKGMTREDDRIKSRHLHNRETVFATANRATVRSR